MLHDRAMPARWTENRTLPVRKLPTFALAGVLSLFELTGPAHSHDATKTDAPRERLAGFVPAPRSLPGIGRWQLATKNPRGRIHAVAWSGDGRRFAFTETTYIRICDAESFDIKHFLVGHAARVVSLDWNHKTNRLASASFDGTVRIWTAEGIPQNVLKGHVGPVNAVAWAKDGSRLASGGSDGTLRIWKGDGTLERVVAASTGPLNCVAWTPDASFLVTGDDNCELRIWSVDGKLQRVCQGHLGRVTAAAVSPDGTRIGSLSVGFRESMDREFADVRVWQADGAPKGSHVSNGLLFGLRWMPDGESMVAFSGQGLHFLGADAALRNVQSVAVGGRVAEPPLAVSPNGKEIVIGATGGVVVATVGNSQAERVLHAERGVRNFRGAYVAAIDRDCNQMLVRFSDPKSKLYGLHLMSAARSSPPADRLQSRLSSQSFSPKNDRIAFVAREGEKQLSIWDLTKNRVEVVGKFDHTIEDAAWNPSDETIACGDDHGVVHVVTSAGRKVLDWHLKSALQMAASDDQEASFSQGPGESLRLRWVNGGKALAAAENTCVEVRRLDGTETMSFDFGGAFQRFWISPNLERAAAWSAGEKSPEIKLRRADGSLAKFASRFPGEVTTYACNRDVTRFVVCGNEGTVKILPLDDPAGVPQEIAAHPNASVSALSFSPDGERFATGAWDALIKIWRVDGTLERTLAQNTLPVTGLWWSDDGKRLVSRASSGAFFCWSLPDWRLESLIAVTEMGEPVQISREGRIRHEDTKLANGEFYVLVERPNASFEMISYEEFAKRIGSKER